VSYVCKTTWLSDDANFAQFLLPDYNIIHLQVFLSVCLLLNKLFQFYYIVVILLTATWWRCRCRRNKRLRQHKQDRPGSQTL